MSGMNDKDRVYRAKLISGARSFARVLNTTDDNEYDEFMGNFEPAELAYLLIALADELEEMQNGNV